MKKTLLLTTAFCASLIATTANAQTRYLDEVFTDVTVTTDIVYGNNFSVITGTPVAGDLKLDLYEPATDVLTDRPLILYLPTGSFLPRYFNQLPTGDIKDSATVNMCERLARQGYVVAAVSYRQGWNPQAATQEMRAQTIIQAVYRGLQDAKTAVRFFRSNVANNSNTYGIDSTKIAVGGQGSGGYISLAYAALDDVTEIQLAKFYNVTDGAFMVDPTIMGDFSGLGGNAALNSDNHAGYTDDISMVFNIGGALGDSTWLNAGEIPIVSLQGEADAFAPYAFGMVTIPGTGGNVVEVSGASDIIRIADAFGNNDVFKTPAITDGFTTQADSYNTALDGAYGNGGNEGLYTFLGAANGNGPWEFWDDATVTAEVNYINSVLMTTLDPVVILGGGYASNPFYQGLGPVAGKARAMAYLDTIQGYLAPRLYRGLVGLTGNTSLSVTEFSATEVSVYPNPATDQISFVSEDSNPISSILFYSLEGKVVRTESNINATNIVVSNLDLPKGIYFANVRFKEGTAVKKIVVQ